MGDEHVNPAVPKTVGALLAEEVTMDPLSPLPSFLEMKMIEEAAASAQRGLKLGLEVVTQRASQEQARYPRQWRARIARFVEYFIRNYEAELRLLVTYFVNRKCLRSNAGASVAESLYGGRRAKLGPVGENGQHTVLPLDDTDKTRLALILALGPYIQERLEGLYLRLKQQQSSAQMCDDTSSVWARLRAAFVAAYPYLHMTKEGTVLMYQWMFLLGKTLHFDPASHLLGQVVRRTTQADTPKQQQDSGKKTESSSFPSAALDPMRKAVLIGLSSTFVLGWLRQFRNLLHTQTRQESNEIPPPAPLPVNLNAKTRLRPLSSNDPKHCPICRQPRINPAAATSGYVFCHRCIVMFVREYGKCPVTGTKCPESRILRIYEPTTTIS
jgi:peroxin-12